MKYLKKTNVYSYGLAKNIKLFIFFIKTIVLCLLMLNPDLNRADLNRSISLGGSFAIGRDITEDYKKVDRHK